MIFKIFICIFLIYFSLFAYAKDLSLATKTSDSFQYSIVKREVDLEIYDDIKHVKEDKNENDAVRVCENDNGKPCHCYHKIISCTDHELKTANLRPAIESFVIETASFAYCRNLTLEEDKVLPGNEATVNKVTFVNCQIRQIDNNVFDSLTSLNTLMLLYSSITLIDENILTEKLGKVLWKLHIYDCKMTNIQPSIFKNLVNLEDLKLGQNQQSSGTFDGVFPESLSKLKFLDLHLCNLSSLNENAFEYLGSLEELNMNENRFTSIPSTIKYLPNLKVLIFGYNELVEIKTNDFASNVNLEATSFVSNLKLEFIENCAFCNLKLKKIYFDQCPNLSYIDENAFGFISNGISPKLDVFSILHCNISVLHENLLDWKNVEKMVLFGNPFVCNCSMAWLFNDLMSNNSIFENKTAHWIYGLHHKFELGCLGPPPTNRNHTIPYTIVEIFSSCEKPSSSLNFYWYFLLLLVCFIIVAVFLIYVNRYRLQTLF